MMEELLDQRRINDDAFDRRAIETLQLASQDRGPWRTRGLC
jgi:hypothetical protein